MTIVWLIVTALLLVSAVLTTIRVLRGPTTLDRLVALDTIVAICMGGLAVWAAYSLDSTVVPAIVALSLLSFVGSAAIARFRVRDDQT
ncbi:monovalent cation/H+ antiporter complex subunit F [Gordonia rhizosphera]|uniref:Putative Na(+)/H(+) antiporter subunit F n=1 Tax=Gordonia rhizosphera NBRC 16068 TaxID=1108045 RepID=K6UXY3_9ACTN|nr:monovalent cation/H+ antiporter complex subunit F [Gordonia rhizosphera]GAB88258.1 putative Na(+)/H(+) antiporter subunit F [Gordonia rhizosphera NBRC 16068]